MQREVGVVVEDVPSAVIEAVEREARERDISRRDVVGQIVADRFRQPWTMSGYPFREADGATTWNVPMTETLRERLRDHAKEHNLTQRGTIILILQLHYGLPTSSARRRPSQPPLPPEVIREARDRHHAGESLRKLEADFRARGIRVKRETLAAAIRQGGAAA